MSFLYRFGASGLSPSPFPSPAGRGEASAALPAYAYGFDTHPDVLPDYADVSGIVSYVFPKLSYVFPSLSYVLEKHSYGVGARSPHVGALREHVGVMPPAVGMPSPAVGTLREHVGMTFQAVGIVWQYVGIGSKYEGSTFTSISYERRGVAEAGEGIIRPGRVKRIPSCSGSALPHPGRLPLGAGKLLQRHSEDRIKLACIRPAYSRRRKFRFANTEQVMLGPDEECSIGDSR